MRIERKAGTTPPFLLLDTDVQACSDRSVALDVLFPEVVQKASALTDHLQKPAARVMVLCVELEVLVQVVDALG